MCRPRPSSRKTNRNSSALTVTSAAPAAETGFLARLGIIDFALRLQLQDHLKRTDNASSETCGRAVDLGPSSPLGCRSAAYLVGRQLVANPVRAASVLLSPAISGTEGTSARPRPPPALNLVRFWADAPPPSTGSRQNAVNTIRPALIYTELLVTLHLSALPARCATSPMVHVRAVDAVRNGEVNPANRQRTPP